MKKKPSTYCSCLTYSVNAMSRLMTKIADEEFAATGLTSSYAFLLMSVNEKPGITPSELTKQLQLTPSTVTRLIEKLEAKGLVNREQSGRMTEVYPTSVGVEMNGPIKKAWDKLFIRYTSLLGQERAERLTKDLAEAIMILE